ncbi:MAG: hypothetical protein A3D16_23515 [Rhodobacterales bacterium RIFCSPHIGHO2_02_FULL_62_130]|nr:MAG: hypothetical protein A3D16_23515 [Rhodobacterales bacterium RIFCSPHIGHO2_02_FULL_62_130]OHC54262.1 MAG: hypothetical protein A3E48_18985 [Rhodobacterales bacterium RIFCSPHIGHO2_12_FULL_62_75]
MPVSGSSSLNLKNLVLVGVIVMSGAHSAKAITVSRCNALVEGVYQPVLVVQPTKGEKTVYHIGDEGLTRQIIFNEAAALAWVKQRFGENAGAVDICGMPDIPGDSDRPYSGDDSSDSVEDSADDGGSDDGGPE